MCGVELESKFSNLADVRDSEETLAKTLRKLQSIDRYEKRITSLKKRVFKKCNWRFS